MRTLVPWVMGLSILMLAATARPDSFCFATASTYYEQLYCELKAQGRGDRLPPFYEFKRNDASVQASLLRRPARRIGVEVPMPQRPSTSAKPPPSQPKTSLPPTPPKQAADRADTAPLSDCALVKEKTRITCGPRDYQLQGNQHNRKLAPDALNADRKMNLPVFRGSPKNDAAVASYLREAYQQYIEQMLAIGLGGVTMSYSKFAFLFDDIQGKELDFSERFDTMYTYLKKDKANMAVSENLTADNHLTLDHCAPLTPELLLCSRGGRNHVYQAK